MPQESILWYVKPNTYFKLGIFSLPYYILNYSDNPCPASKVDTDVKNRIRGILYKLLFDSLQSFLGIYQDRLELHLITQMPASIQALKIANELNIRHVLYLPLLNEDTYHIDDVDLEVFRAYKNKAASIHIYQDKPVESIYSKLRAITETEKHVAKTVNQALVIWNYQQNRSEAYKTLNYMSSFNNYGCVWNLWAKYCKVYEQEFNIQLTPEQTRFHKKHLFKVSKFEGV